MYLRLCGAETLSTSAQNSPGRSAAACIGDSPCCGLTRQEETIREPIPGATLQMIYLVAGSHVVLGLSYVNPGAAFKASLVVFKTKYHLLFFSLACMYCQRAPRSKILRGA
jgi:hypothetical protein